MKKKTILIIILLVVGSALLFLISITLYHNLMRDKLILRGFSSFEEYVDKFKFQDYTDYCKYFYNNSFDEKFASTEEYNVIKEEDISDIVDYFNNFKDVVEFTEKIKKYDFDTGIIGAGDFVHIVTKEGKEIGNSSYGKYDDYTVYFYDVASHTLYYIHTNI